MGPGARAVAADDGGCSALESAWFQGVLDVVPMFSAASRIQ